MKHLACSLALLVATASPAWSAEQSFTVEPHISPAQDAGLSLLAATANLVYFPARLVVTVITAEVGGFTGWMTGGDTEAANSVWAVTDGQAFLTPRILEGRERLCFGRLPRPSREPTGMRGNARYYY